MAIRQAQRPPDESPPPNALRLYLTGRPRERRAAVADLLVRRHGFEHVSLSPTCCNSGRSGQVPVGLMACLAQVDRDRVVVDGLCSPEEAQVLRQHGFLGVRVRDHPQSLLSALASRLRRTPPLGSGPLDVAGTAMPTDHEIDAHVADVSILVAALETLTYVRCGAVRTGPLA